MKNIYRKEKNSFSQTIRKVKSLFTLEVSKSIPVSLDHFSILNKGNSFKHTYSWKIKHFEIDTYLLSIKNSHIEQTTGTINYSQVNVDVENKFLAILIHTKKNLPDLCIRPAYIADKIANLFLRFDVKLKNKKDFNNQFILETNGTLEKLSLILTDLFIDKILNKNGFHLEIKKSTILLKFEKGANTKDTIELLEITKILIQVLKKSN